MYFCVRRYCGMAISYTVRFVVITVCAVVTNNVVLFFFILWGIAYLAEMPRANVLSGLLGYLKCQT